MTTDIWPFHRVADLQKERVLLVEDGNHGEYRPRRTEFGLGETRFIRASSLDRGRVLFDTADRISEEAVDRIRKGIGRGGDVLFSHKGTVGKLAIVPLNAPPFVCSPQTTFWRVVDAKRLDRRFLYYFMSSSAFESQWKARKGETDMADYVSLTAQRQFKLQLPEISEQRAIARILGALDDKIELNRQMNQTLEAMAQAIFKSWFVDFDPVTAKAAGQKPFGMDAETAALFPDSFVDSELGPIPEGWEVEPIGSLFEFVIGGDWGKEEADEKHTQRTAVIRGTDFGRIRSNRESEIPSRFVQPKKLEKRQLRRGDLILEISGGSRDQPTGRSVLVTEGLLARLGGVAVPASFCRLIRPRSCAESLFLASYLRMLYSQGGTWNYQVQSTGISNFQFKYFAERELLPMPPNSPSPLDTFETVVSRLIERTDSNRAESCTLADLRDTLLPRLLSGEIRVGQAEEEVEKAV